MTLTNHRPFQNRPTLDAKNTGTLEHFCSSESHESRIFGISALKTIVLKNKTKLFFDLQLVNYAVLTSSRRYDAGNCGFEHTMKAMYIYAGNVARAMVNAGICYRSCGAVAVSVMLFEDKLHLG